MTLVDSLNNHIFFLFQGVLPERLVTGSDDFTMFMWNPESDKKSIARLTGHSQVVNDVQFSPDTDRQHNNIFGVINGCIQENLQLISLIHIINVAYRKKAF